MMHRSLPARLRVLRARRGLTLIDAAEKIGIGRDTLSDLERGNRHPVMPTLAKIAEGYGVPVEELLEEEPVPLGEASRGEAAEQGADPLDGWIGRALSEGDFARDFERAKGSQELADELHRAKIAESDERHQVWDTLRKNDAPPAAILEARRDLVVSNAQLTAAAFLAVERWRGRAVAGMDPRAIVADVLRNQREHLAGGDEMEPTAQSGESA
jgi:transcriptional regulator with XRE-family HTH domain